MPLYAYVCPEGHKIDHLHRLSDGDRPASILCAEHGLEAQYTFSPTKPKRFHADGTWTEEERARRQAPPAMAMFNYSCVAKDCGEQFEELVVFAHGERSETPRPCPRCGEPSPMGLNYPHPDGTLKMYPYFNRGLDMVVESPAHLRQICKERGLTPVEGDYDASRMYADHMRPYREAEAYMEKLRDEMKHSPAWAAYRKRADAENGGKPLEDYTASRGVQLP